MRERASIRLKNNEQIFHEYIQSQIAEARLNFPHAEPLDLRDMNKEIGHLVNKEIERGKKSQVSLFSNPSNVINPAVLQEAKRIKKVER